MLLHAIGGPHHGPDPAPGRLAHRLQRLAVLPHRAGRLGRRRAAGRPRLAAAPVDGLHRARPARDPPGRDRLLRRQHLAGRHRGRARRRQRHGGGDHGRAAVPAHRLGRAVRAGAPRHRGDGPVPARDAADRRAAAGDPVQRQRQPGEPAGLAVRRPDRPGQPQAPGRPDPAGDRRSASRRDLLRPVPARPRPVQGGQRRPRPPGRRRGAAPGGRPAACLLAPGRRRGPARRRRVRHPAAPGARPGDGLGGRRAGPGRPGRAPRPGRPAARPRGQHGHRARPRPRERLRAAAVPRRHRDVRREGRPHRHRAVRRGARRRLALAARRAGRAAPGHRARPDRAALPAPVRRPGRPPARGRGPGPLAAPGARAGARRTTSSRWPSSPA